MAKTTKDDWERKPLYIGKNEWIAEYERDKQLWLEAIYPQAMIDGEGGPPAYLAGQKDFLRRLFLLLRYGLLEYRVDNKHDKSNMWRNWNKPIAAALSHGGRVIINMARLDGQRQGGWSWLLTGNPRTVPHGGKVPQPVLNSTLLKGRFGSTHGTDVRALNIKGQDRGELYEKKGIMQNITRGLNPESHLWGMNVALGGWKGKNSQGHDIAADGSHGHLHILYRQIYKLLSGPYAAGLLIGCENKEHGVQTRYPGNKTHLGTGHGAGGKQKVSATNGLKWKDLGKVYKAQKEVPAEYNGMRVNVLQTQWVDIRAKETAITTDKTLAEQKALMSKVLAQAPSAMEPWWG
jgi:hypothetical protein